MMMMITTKHQRVCVVYLIWMAIGIPFFLLGNVVQSFSPSFTTTVVRSQQHPRLSFSSHQEHGPSQVFPRYWTLLTASSNPQQQPLNYNNKLPLFRGIKSRVMFWKRRCQPPPQNVITQQQQQQQQQQRLTFKSLLQLHITLSHFLTSGWKRFRHATLIFSMATFIWMASLSISHAASTTTAASSATSSSPTTISHVMPSKASSSSSTKKLDRLIQRYIQDYMFDDDLYDPLESALREAHEDVTKGTYPRQLSTVTSSILGQQGSSSRIRGSSPTSIGTTSSSSSDGTTSSDSASQRVGQVMIQLLRFLQRRLRVSETTAMNMIAALLVVTIPSLFLLFGMVVGGMSKRQMNRIMKQRYGDTYTYVHIVI